MIVALVITGHQSSGTTLLFHLCNSHPDIEVTMEFGNFLSLGKSYPAYMTRMLKRWVGIGLRNWPLQWQTNRRDWSAISKLNRHTTIWHNHAFVLKYFSKMARYRKSYIDSSAIEVALQEFFSTKRIVGDKYPEYIFELGDLAKDKKLSIVVIYRDCRDVTNSALKKIHGSWREMKFFIKKLDTAEKIAQRWVKAINLMNQHKNRVYTIRYEDLVNDRKQQLKLFGQWLGVDPDGFDASMIRNNRIGTHKRGLSKGDLEAVIQIAGPTMAELGYLG